MSDVLLQESSNSIFFSCRVKSIWSSALITQNHAKYHIHKNCIGQEKGGHSLELNETDKVMQNSSSLLFSLDELDKLAEPKSVQGNKEHFCKFFEPHLIRMSQHYKRRTVKNVQMPCAKDNSMTRCNNSRYGIAVNKKISKSYVKAPLQQTLEKLLRPQKVQFCPPLILLGHSTL